MRVAGLWCLRSVVVGLLALCLGAHAAEPPQKNVLLIVVDDLRDFGGAYLPAVVKTPNIDRLRKRGVTFERAYVQYPVCNPSRCSMLTGLRAEQTGVTTNDLALREALPEVVTLPQLCREKGWRAAAFGKIFHLGGKGEAARKLWVDHGRSWDAAKDYAATPLGRNMLAGRNVTNGALKWCYWGMADGEDSDQPDGQIAADTVAAIDAHGGKPWFIGCGFMKPHDPFIAPRKYFELYPPDALKIWRDPADTTPAPPMAVGFSDYGPAFAAFTDKERLELFRAYCAATSFMDAQLGKVLDVLDRRNLWDSTLVIFTGDHGYHTGERNWWNKNTLFERSCRAPLIVAAPGVKGGRTSRALVEFVDLYPTVAEFCGLTPPHTLAGTSLFPLLREQTESLKDAAFTLVTRGAKGTGRSVRVERWRFTRWNDGATELYDHAVDPEELQNVATAHPEVVRQLDERLKTMPEIRATK